MKSGFFEQTAKGIREGLERAHARGSWKQGTEDKHCAVNIEQNMTRPCICGKYLEEREGWESWTVPRVS